MKPVSKQHLPICGLLFTTATALVFAVCSAWAAPAPANPPLAPPPPQQYAQCLALAHTNPQRAYDEAQGWREAGGGFPAQHCEAVALIGLKKYAEAANKLENLAGAMMLSGPDLRGEALDQAGQAWILAGQIDKAKADFDGAIAYAPKNSQFLTDRAEALALEKKFFEALDDLNRAIALDPKNVEALIYRASAYRQINSLSLALDDIKRALDIEPDAAPAYLERGIIRRLKNDTAGARADWKHVEALAPNSPAAEAAKEDIAGLLAPVKPSMGAATPAPTAAR